jgi:proteasome lid subunit RPN8/RPN11
MPFRLLLARKFYDAMVAQALAERPNECVGLLAGVKEEEGGAVRVLERYPLDNESETPTTEYRSEGKLLARAWRDIRERGMEIVGIYHSHPTSSPVPSGKDLKQNYYGDEVVHFIVSLTTDPPVVRGWHLSAEGYLAVDLELI